MDGFFLDRKREKNICLLKKDGRVSEKMAAFEAVFHSEPRAWL